MEYIDLKKRYNKLKERAIVVKKKATVNLDKIEIASQVKENALKELEQTYKIISHFDNKNKAKIIDKKVVIVQEKQESYEEKIELQEPVKKLDISEMLDYIVEKSEKQENKRVSFEEILTFGLKNGYVEYKQIKKLDFENEDDVSNEFEAVEELESRDIDIKYEDI